ncbi:MAG: hypothetical protein ACNI3H_12630 [Halarcobacter ebronensis]
MNYNLRLDNLNISENGFGNLYVEDGKIFMQKMEIISLLVGYISTAYFTDDRWFKPRR